MRDRAARLAARPLLAALAALVTACGGGSSSTAITVAPTTAGATTATPSATAAPTAATALPPTSAASAAATPDSCAVGTQPALPSSISAAFATALAVAPDGRLFWAERSGTVRVYQDGGARTFASVATVTTEAGGGYSERGLLGLALSHSFATDHLVFAFYSDPDRATQHVVRWRDCAGTAMDKTLLATFPSGSDCCHKGGRVAVGPDGKLYVSLGEEHTAAAAQNTGDVRGKILRYNLDGSIPADNPFGAQNPVWAYGFRNPFGIAFSSTGQLAVTGNGPSGDDGSPSTGYDLAYTSVTRGTGYQWPNCYGYSHTLNSTGCGNGQPGPDWSSETSTVIPTGAAFVDSSGPAGLAGHLVFCTYAHGMEILTPGSPHASVTAGPAGCTLDVVQGPDHAVWYSDTSHITRQA